MVSTAPGKYAAKPTAEITAENKRNIVLEKDQLRSVKYTPGHSYVDCCRKVQEIDGDLEIVTAKTKYSLNVPFRRTTVARDILSKADISSLEIIKKENDSEKPHASTGSCCSH